jgi:hypothetical protein
MIQTNESVSGLRYGKRASVTFLAQLFSGFCKLLVPVMPVVVALLLMDRKFISQYKLYVAKFRVHFEALSRGPVEHYFNDVFFRFKQVPVTIQGECVQCGNCCLNRQCAFLESIPGDKYQCGIYGSNLRRFSNCGSFPLHAQDIARYECPSYFVAGEQPIVWRVTAK